METCDCDGAQLAITLTRDRQMMIEERESKSMPISLQVTKGVQMGDSVQAVRSALGNPTKSSFEGRYLRWNYTWKQIKNGQGFYIYNDYVFKASKLIEVTFGRETVPGC